MDHQLSIRKVGSEAMVCVAGKFLELLTSGLISGESYSSCLRDPTFWLVDGSNAMLTVGAGSVGRHISLFKC